MSALTAANENTSPFEDGSPEASERYRAARVGVRLVTGLVLRWVKTVNAIHDNDVVHALVFFTLWSNNIAHLPSDPLDKVNEIPDDSLRRPVTAREVATVLSLPYETVRRRIQELVADGKVDRVTGGFIVPRRALLRPEMIDGLWQSHENLLQLLHEVDQAGIRGQDRPS